MYAIMVIAPIVIYWIIIIITWFVKIRHFENALKRRVIFILLLLFPFLDHIIIYSYYKTLCYFNSGIKVYKTFPDIETQKINWFYPNRTKGYIFGRLKEYDVINEKYPNITTIYINECRLKKRCKMTEEKIKERNISPVFKKEIIDKLYKENPIAHLPQDGLIQSVLLLKNEKLELAYITACKWVKSYDCKKIEQLINKYNLTNVIYTSPNYIRRKSTKKRVFINIHSYKSEIYNMKTKEVYAEKTNYNFFGGWYYHLIATKVVALDSCYRYSLTKLEEQVVPNPFKKEDQE